MAWQTISYARKLVASARLFFNEYKPLIISLSVIAAFSLLLWQFASGSWSDFGLNAFTETVGIILTVFLVEQIIKNQERRRLRPLEVAAFRDVQTFVDGLAMLWLSIYNWVGKDESSPPPKPPSMQEFLTKRYFEEIRFRLNLDAEACVYPKRTWRQFLPQAEDDFRKLGDKILERHAAVLNPQAYDLVHKMLYGFLGASVESPGLWIYWTVIEGNLKDFAELHEWYRENKKLYLGHDYPNSAG